MRLNIRALAIAGAILWGGGFFLVALGNMLWPSYGLVALELGSSIYPGYGGPGGVGSLLVITLYAALDGAVAGAVLAWLYNRVAVAGRAPDS